MNRLRLVAAWFVAAAVSVGVAWGVLSAAAGQVAEGPETPVLVVDSPSTTSTASTASTTAPTTSLSPGTSHVPTTNPATPTTTQTTISRTTSTSPATTSTTTPPAAWQTTTIPTAGGVVVVRHRPGEVRLDSATPAPGFSMDIDESGPDEVKVEFENDDEDYEVRVEWKDGVLTTETD